MVCWLAAGGNKTSCCWASLASCPGRLTRHTQPPTSYQKSLMSAFCISGEATAERQQSVSISSAGCACNISGQHKSRGTRGSNGPPER